MADEEMAMALSARDRHILESIENELLEQDRAWVARFARLGGTRPPSLLKGRWKLFVAIVCWVGLVAADAATDPATLLWVALSTCTLGGILMIWMHRASKRQAPQPDTRRRYLQS
jgi:Protein of unknown function (DUF3040)